MANTRKRCPGFARFTSRAQQPQIQFVILVAYQGLIKKAQFLKLCLPPAAVGHRIDVSFVLLVVKRGAAGRESGVVRRGHGAGHKAAGAGSRSTAHVIGSGALDMLRRIVDGVVARGRYVVCASTLRMNSPREMRMAALRDRRNGFPGNRRSHRKFEIPPHKRSSSSRVPSCSSQSAMMISHVVVSRGPDVGSELTKSQCAESHSGRR